jgi:hypothetical protein
MKNRVFIMAVAVVGALALLILLNNVREATAPFFGPPNVDEGLVMSKVEGGELSFREALFYAVESDRDSDSDEEAAEAEEEPQGVETRR